MTYNPEMSASIDSIFEVKMLGGRALLAASDELRSLQLIEGMQADDETLEPLLRQAEEFNQMRRGDTAHIIGSGQYYLDTKEDEPPDELCKPFFNVENGRLEGRYVDMSGTSWPRYDDFSKKPAITVPEGTLCVELEDAIIYDNSGVAQAYYPNHLTYVPLNSTQYKVYHEMKDWLSEGAL